MKVFDHTKRFKKDFKRPLILALGNFDGIHRGHQRLLRYVISQARRLGGRPAVFTFQNHPQNILHPRHRIEKLQSLDQKLLFFKNMGIQICFLQKFDRRFAAFSAEKFIKKILSEDLGIREICLGYNARFGRGRRGDVSLLKQLGPAGGFKVFQSSPVLWRGKPVSSTLVREAVRTGKMETAAGCLGRPWSLEGKVVRGDSRGRKLGFPTANLGLGDFARPALGVYAARIRVGGSARALNGVVNVGVRPSFGKGSKLCVEAHIFNFKKNLYGKKIEIFFIKHLRGEKKFKSAELLKRQILKDIQKARSLLRGKKTVV